MARSGRRKKAPPSTYERRLILFIDFLGFKEVVARTASRPDRLSALVAALDELGGMNGSTSQGSRTVTQFSDSVVVSYEITETSAVFWLLNDVATMVIRLVHHGFLLRGAVTIGKLLHTGRHVVGPAMVKAYEMESKLACHPRVIVDPKILKSARRHRQAGHSPAEEEEHVRSFLSEDRDGRLYIDYVAWRLVVEVAGLPDEAYPGYLRVLSDIVRRGLRHPDPSVLRKFLWLHARYLDALERIAASPADSPHRMTNPEYHEAVFALPRLRRRAAAASARVRAAERDARRAARR